MRKQTFMVTNEQGIHSRYAVQLVNISSRFKCSISLKFKGKMVDLKSIMGVMSLGVYSNEKISVLTMGIDEDEALQRLTVEFLESKIGALIENAEDDDDNDEIF